MEIMMQVIALLTGLVGLIEAAIMTWQAIKNRIAQEKAKTAAEQWNTIQTFADAVIKETEHSGVTGSQSKLDYAVEKVTNGCKAIGLNIAPFTEQLIAYINDTVKFVNEFNKKENK